MDQDFHTISNGGLRIVPYNANPFPLPSIPTPNLTPPPNVVPPTILPQDGDNANNENIPRNLEENINYDMDNELLFYVDNGCIS